MMDAHAVSSGASKAEQYRTRLMVKHLRRLNHLYKMLGIALTHGTQMRTESTCVAETKVRHVQTRCAADPTRHHTKMKGFRECVTRVVRWATRQVPSAQTDDEHLETWQVAGRLGQMRDQIGYPRRVHGKIDEFGQNQKLKNDWEMDLI
jgi:hypothetical protein